ncbi:MAG: hypothetical protein M3124_02490, partial [Actinomycetota bacterium]|nr:hypothetical protein [Actinomycetota bacterium]
MAVTTIFLVVLALAWAGVFLPAVWRARQRTPLKSSERFARRMKLIAPPPGIRRIAGSRRRYRGGRRLIVSRHAGRKLPSHRRSQRQRTRILLLLGVLVPISATAAAHMQGNGWWEIHIACDFSFALYVALLLEAKKRRNERLKKVRPLATRRPTRVQRGRRATAAR